MDVKGSVCQVVLAAILTLGGCSSGSQTSVPVPDANTPTGPRDGVADTTSTSPSTCKGDFFEATSCNTVLNDATAVLFTPGVGDAPTFTGGTIVDGLYHATKAEAWGASTGTGRRFTLVVLEGGTKFYYAGDILNAQGGVATSMVATATVSTSGNQLNHAIVCTVGSVQIPVESYTATSTELILAVVQDPVVTATTYTRVGCP